MRLPMPNVKRVDRLIATTVLSTLAIVWLILVGFDTLGQFLKQLGHVGQHGYTLSKAAIYIADTIPRRMYEHFGNAALIGGLLGLGGLAGSGELTALRAAGMSKLRIAASVTAVVAVLTLAVMLIGETLAPAGDQRAQAIQLALHSDNIGLTTRSGLWARDGGDVVNAKGAQAVREDGHQRVQLVDVRVFSFDDSGQLTEFRHAKSAENDGRDWTLKDLRINTLDADGVHSREVASEPWKTHLDARVLEQSIVHPQYLSMRDLYANMQYLRANGQNPGAYAVSFWSHALYPLNVLVLVLCAMPFAFGALRSGGLGKRLFIGVLLAIAWYFLQQSMTNFGTVYGLSPMLANLLPAMVLVIVATLYFRRHG
ncbi:LPS export ABC transporter permease LptG [Oleiagrimonas soli]|uniref:Lipopolysaccharide export system permease protein n=1 Tax=Oleiagrimonas soli TaxID=1543381 RepID=A0A841KGQ7_9GAMM|nr:lipopolysaccharide export system permease protein [Oleiagrimonas soli]